MNGLGLRGRVEVDEWDVKGGRGYELSVGFV